MLPTLVQLPLLLGLYAALRDLSAHDAAFLAPWLWLADLHQPDVLAVAGVTLPGPLPVLAARAQWAQQRLFGATAGEEVPLGRSLAALASPCSCCGSGCPFRRGCACTGSRRARPGAPSSTGCGAPGGAPAPAPAPAGAAAGAANRAAPAGAAPGRAGTGP